MDYCCDSFKAHVKSRFFRIVDKWDYDTRWMVLAMQTRKRDGWFVWDFPEADMNWMPIYNCPFCGKKLEDE